MFTNSRLETDALLRVYCTFESLQQLTMKLFASTRMLIIVFTTYCTILIDMLLAWSPVSGAWKHKFPRLGQGDLLLYFRILDGHLLLHFERQRGTQKEILLIVDNGFKKEKNTSSTLAEQGEDGDARATISSHASTNDVMARHRRSQNAPCLHSDACGK